MPLVEWSLDQLREYAPEREEPADFDEFWAGTLAQTRAHDLAPEFVKVDSGLKLVDTYDVTFSGWDGQRVRGWLVLPGGITDPVPAVVEFPGYGGGRGLPHEVLLWAAAGWGHFYLDVRGQGSSWRPGDTPDPEPQGSNPHYPGFMTRGVLDPKTYYYRRVVADAVRAVEAARAHPLVDVTKVAVQGGSQGGGLTIMVAGLVSDLAAAAPDVPFLCHYRRALDISTSDPYGEIDRYLRTHRDKVERVFATLPYFDGVNFAARANAPALFSAGLEDLVCPPSTVFAAYHHWAGPKSIEVYRFNGHEGGGPYQTAAVLKFLTRHLS